MFAGWLLPSLRLPGWPPGVGGGLAQCQAGPRYINCKVSLRGQGRRATSSPRRGRLSGKQAPVDMCGPRRPVHRCWHLRPGSLDVEPNEDGWYPGPARRRPAPSQAIGFPSDSVWQGGKPDRRPEVSGTRLLLMESQMDMNVYRPRKHFSAENGLSSRPADPDVLEGGLSRPAQLIDSPLIGPEARARGITRLPAPILTDFPGDWLQVHWRGRCMAQAGVLVFHLARPNP